MIVFLAVAASAQVNADVLASQIVAPGPALGLKAGLSASTGNVDSLALSGEAAFQVLTLHETPPGPPPFFRDRALVFASVRRSVYGGEVVESEGLAHVRYTRMVIPRLGPEVFAQLQYSRFLLLAERTLAGGGARFDLVHRKDVGVWGGTGAMFEHETLSDGTETSVVRSTSYASVRWTVSTDRLTLVSTTYLQPRLDLPEDFRVLEEGRVEAKVTRVFSFGTELVVRHDARPPEGVEPTDVRLGSTIQVRLARRPPEPPP